MKNKAALSLILSFFVLSISAQEQVDITEIKTEMSKLSFMTGNWSGNGWHMGPDRVKHEFDQTEMISFKLDGTVMVIEGKGMSNGELIHDALAVISYDPKSKTYEFKSYLSDGRTGDFVASVENNKFVWNLNDNMRYKIDIDDEGQWFEVGEIFMNNTWNQFFEMTLHKGNK